MTPQELKNSILQLAIQGRLVEQRPEEGTAEELYAQIQAEKAQLIREKKIKKDKALPAIDVDEMLFEIPESWVWCYVGDLFQHNTGKALNGTTGEGTVLPYITTSNLYWDEFRLDNLKKMSFKDSEVQKCTVRKGDLLVIEGGFYFGRAAVWNYDYEMRIQNHIHRLRPYGAVDIYFFYYLFYLFKQAGWIDFKGIGMQGLSSSAIHKLQFPLPPLAEQKRIVAKIEELLPYIDRYEQAWSKLEDFNKKFPTDMQKSILQMAIQGKLVEQRPQEGTAEELYAQIQAEKAQLIKDGKIKKQKPLPEITEDEVPFEIPESWKWVRLGNLSKLITKGSSPKWQGIKYVEDGLLFVTSENVGKEQLLLANPKYLETEFNDIQPRSILRKNDILTNIVGASIGRSAIYDLDEIANINQAVCLTRLVNSDLSQYIIKFLNGPFAYSQMLDNQVDTARANISLTNMAEFLIPLPPLAEQQRIVAKLEEILPLCEGLK